MSTPSNTFIGFPPPLLGLAPQRLPILYHEGELLVLSKPGGVLVLPDPWYPRLPTLQDAVNYQARSAKPELVRLGIGENGIGAVFPLDPECSGMAMFGTKEQTVTDYSNTCGSNQMLFRFIFVASGVIPIEVFSSNLPIARHQQDARVLVSTRTGKKSETHFKLLERWGKYGFWEAVTTYPRMHQIRVHAMESGLRILGDRMYGDTRPLFLSQIKKDYRRSRQEETPIFEGTALHLSDLRFPGPDGNEVTVKAPPPGKFQTLCKRLREHC